MSKKTSAQIIGAMGEDAAERYLKKEGYTVVGRNYRCRSGEIDIIASDGKYIVFAEVKTRSINSLDRPGAWVDRKKQNKIITSAYMYLDDNDTDLQPRFDVIEVVYDNVTGMIISVEHIEDAFMQEGDYSVF